jgi:multiple antibiotic resistance protein
MIGCVESLNLADAFVTFVAVLGPQKVLLSVVRMSRGRSVRNVRLVALYAAVAAAFVGVACALAAPWIATFFHITTASVELSAGLVFFVYAVGLVFGVHLGEDQEDSHQDDGHQDDGPDSSARADENSGEHAGEHPVSSGLRDLLLPFIVSPLGVAAALESSLVAQDWKARATVAAAYAAVAVVDLIAVLAFTPLLRRAHPTSLEFLSRLLGVLLTAVGVAVFLHGLSTLGVHLAGPAH